VIGGGNYGQIFRGFYGKDAVAIKKLVMELDQEDDTKSAMSEAQLLWDLRHPRILVFFGMCKRKTTANTEIYLVMELCVGSLDLYLEDRKKSRKKRRAKEKQKQVRLYYCNCTRLPPRSLTCTPLLRPFLAPALAPTLLN